MERVRVYGRSAAPHRGGRRRFAPPLMQCWSHLPVVEEGRLNDPHELMLLNQL
jgi:hypothetical protein